MVRKMKRAFRVVKERGFGSLVKRTVEELGRRIYRLRAKAEDWRIGKLSLNERIPSKYQEQGAYATQSTDYRCLQKMFRAIPLKQDDVFLDVGCGQGRVLTYLYLRRFRGRMLGIELDADVAAMARTRVEKCSNIEIICRNILECEDIIAQASVFYLFNPFNRHIMSAFAQLIEKNCKHPIRLYYCNDVYRDVFEGQEAWSILRTETVRRLGSAPMNYTIYQFSPQ